MRRANYKRQAEFYFWSIISVQYWERNLQEVLNVIQRARLLYEMPLGVNTLLNKKMANKLKNIKLQK